MKISFNRLKPENAEEKSRIMAAMECVLDSGYYILGPEVKAFEDAFAKYIGVKHAIGVANGLEALQISLMALEIGPGDEVITTALSAEATSLSIKAAGAKPILVDIDGYYHLDSAKIESAINKNTRAIIPVHLYGQCADMDTIASIAKKHNLYVVEDCAQAAGTTFNDKKAGSFGIFGCFSFYPTKNLGAIGDAGLITTNDDTLAEKCRIIRNYGQKSRYEHVMYGVNSRLDELQAAILSEKLKDLDTNNSRRVKIAEQYSKNLRGVGDLKLPETRNGSTHIYHLFVIQTSKRDELQEYLKQHEIETLIHYPVLAVKNILSLPLYPSMTEEEVRYVCNTIKYFYEKR